MNKNFRPDSNRRNDHSYHQDPPHSDNVNKAFDTLKTLGTPKEWCEKNSKRLVNEVCDPLGKEFSNTINTSQIRKFLNEVKRLDMEFKVEKVPFLQAKLAYATGRNKNQLGKFQEIVDYALKKVEDEKDYRGFKELILGIVAYHKYHGGKD